MPHSAEFNERRRVAYREGRKLGMAPRDAGHLYGPAYVERAAHETPLPPKVTYEDPLSVREARFDAKYGGRGKILPVNSAPTYTKVTVTIETDDGERFDKTVTIRSQDALTRGEMADEVGSMIDKGNISPTRSGTERGHFVAAYIEEATFYPDVRYDVSTRY